MLLPGAGRNFGKGSERVFEYYVIPSSEIARHVVEAHLAWLAAPGRNDRPHQDNKMGIVHLPTHTPAGALDISGFRERWDLIADALAKR